MSTDEKAKSQPAASKVASLSPREFQVCEAIWSEAPDKLICDGLRIAPGTLRSYLLRAAHKLGVRGRVGIARQFERQRLTSRKQNADSGNADKTARRRRRKLAS